MSKKEKGINLEEILRQFGKGLAAPFVLANAYDWKREDFMRIKRGMKSTGEWFSESVAFGAGAGTSLGILDTIRRKVPYGNIIVPLVALKTNKLSLFAARLTSVKIDPRYLDELMEETAHTGIPARKRKRSIKMAYKFFHALDDKVLEGYEMFFVNKDLKLSEKVFQEAQYKNGLLMIADTYRNSAQQTAQRSGHLSMEEITLLTRDAARLYRQCHDRKGLEYVETMYHNAGYTRVQLATEVDVSQPIEYTQHPHPEATNLEERQEQVRNRDPQSRESEDNVIYANFSAKEEEQISRKERIKNIIVSLMHPHD